MSILNNSLLLGAAAAGGGAGYTVERSLRFNSSDSAYCSRTPSTAGNRKTWTWAGWVKRSALGRYSFFSSGSSTNACFGLEFASSDRLWVYNYTSDFDWQLVTTSVYRDPSAWYHIVLSVDTTQGTASNRVRLYVNGTEVTIFTTATYPSSNADTYVSTATLHTIGCFRDLNLFTNGYLADVHFIDGQALTPSSFTEVSATTGQLIPKAYTGSFGTNGFWLKFSDNSAATATTLGKDYSGNGNNWTPNNLSVTAGAGNDSLVDTPTSYGTDTGAGGEVRGNYAIFNPLLKATNTTLSNGNLDFVSATAAGAYESAISTIGVSSGKWYAEFLVITGGNDSVAGVTWAPYNIVNGWPGGYANSIGYEAVLGKFYKDGVGGQTVNTYGVNDVIGVALDLDNAAIWFSKNGTWQGTGSPNPATNTSPAYSSLTAGTYFFAAGTGGSGKIAANFGQRPFAYTAPSGFKALCTQNLPTPTITKPSTVMDVALYTGNGGTQTISGLGFSPDLLWIKARSQAYAHRVYDQIRGTTKALYISTADAEGAYQSTYETLTSFNSDGFSVGTASVTNTINENTATFVAWTWDAGSSTVTNTSGTISSQVRANASAGFSVVTYTGTGANATVGHGLGVAPEMVIVKRRDTTGNWQVRHTSITAANSIQLNLTNAAASATTVWNSTVPSSTVFSVGTDATINASAGTYVAYCFAPVAGYSAFGSYTGNGSADGPFVYTGFRPRWVMVKCSSAVDGWVILDTARDSYNLALSQLIPNLSNAEDTTNNYFRCDLLSNGFKLRTSSSPSNSSGATYIYAAFAENPFQYARAR